MDTSEQRVIVGPGAEGTGANVHHRDFPEIRAEGETPQEAAEQLLNHLSRALDSAMIDWKREAIQNAINDVKAFAGAEKP